MWPWVPTTCSAIDESCRTQAVLKIKLISHAHWLPLMETTICLGEFRELYLKFQQLNEEKFLLVSLLLELRLSCGTGDREPTRAPSPVMGWVPRKWALLLMHWDLFTDCWGLLVTGEISFSVERQQSSCFSSVQEELPRMEDLVLAHFTSSFADLSS